VSPVFVAVSIAKRRMQDGIKSDSCRRADPSSAHLSRQRPRSLPMSRALWRRRDPQYRNRRPTRTHPLSAKRALARLIRKGTAFGRRPCWIHKKSAPHFQRSAFVSRRGCANQLQYTPDRPGRSRALYIQSPLRQRRPSSCPRTRSTNSRSSGNGSHRIVG
jgi:hypothetical protein